MSSTITHKLGRVELLQAVRIAQALRLERDAALAEWKADAAAEHAAGYRAHYCVHGVNLWVDYDAICGSCEEYGFNGFDPLDAYRYALAFVRAEQDRQAEVINALLVLQREAGLETGELMDLHARSRNASRIPERFRPLLVTA